MNGAYVSTISVTGPSFDERDRHAGAEGAALDVHAARLELAAESLVEALGPLGVGGRR